MSFPFRILAEAGSILFLALFLAFSSNVIRTDGLPLKGDWSEDALQKQLCSEDLSTIPLIEAYQAFQKGEAFFIDARSWNAYSLGHIKGALSLPWEEVISNDQELEGFLPKDADIITYCDGAACTLSSNLALLMEEMGYSNVKILVDGWSLWKNANYPIEKERDG